MIGLHRTTDGGSAMRRDERPLRRVNPSGEVRWVARYTNHEGERKSGGTFEKRGPCKRSTPDGSCCAQHRIWRMYELDVPAELRPPTVREYAETVWLQRHPRSERTEKNYTSSLRAVTGALTADGPFGDLQVRAVRPRHLDDLVNVMLREHGRAASGVRKILATVSALYTDAIRDELAEMNPALYVRVRDSDPRIQREARRPVVLSWQEMHAFALGAGPHEPMVRVLGDCGLRLGEMLALECKHVQGDLLIVEQSAWRGVVTPGTKQGSRREVPLPPRLGSLLASAKRDRIGLLFPAPGAWHERSFYRYVWDPARKASGLNVNPHDFRHSYVTLMRTAGANTADLAFATGHTEETATAKYSHPRLETFDLMRRAVGD